MSQVFKKLNFKDQSSILVLDAPPSFESEISTLGEIEVHRRPGAVRETAFAIDEDWSALRFRRVEYIKTMKRDPKRALSQKGKRRTKG